MKDFDLQLRGQKRRECRRQKPTLRKVRIDFDKKNQRKSVKLQEETVYELEHVVEKKVAVVLKDENDHHQRLCGAREYLLQGVRR